MVINRVRVLGRGPHTPTQFFCEYPPPRVLEERCRHVRETQVKKNLRGRVLVVTAGRKCRGTHFYWAFHCKIPGNNWKIEKVVLFSRWKLSDGNVCYKFPQGISITSSRRFSRLRTSTGSGLFAILSRDFEHIFSLYTN